MAAELVEKTGGVFFRPADKLTDKRFRPEDFILPAPVICKNRLKDFEDEEEETRQEISYIGSFEVLDDTCGKKRFEFVRQQIENIRHFIAKGEFIDNCKLVLFIISNSGVKMCSLDEKVVHMAHALKRISYATCDPDYFLFAFVAREPTTNGVLVTTDGQPDQPVVDDDDDGVTNGHFQYSTDDQYQFSRTHRQYCHVYRTESREKAEEINAAISKAFRAAYVERARKSLLFEQRPIDNGGHFETPPVEKSLIFDQIQPENENLLNCPCSPIKKVEQPVTANHVTQSTNGHVTQLTDNGHVTPTETSNGYVPIVRMRVKKGGKMRNMVSTGSQCVESHFAEQKQQNYSAPAPNNGHSYSAPTPNNCSNNSNNYSPQKPTSLYNNQQIMQIRQEHQHNAEKKQRRPLSAAFLFLNKKEKSHKNLYNNNNNDVISNQNNLHTIKNNDVIGHNFNNNHNNSNKNFLPGSSCLPYEADDSSSNVSLLNHSYPALSSSTTNQNEALDEKSTNHVPKHHKRLSATFGNSFFKRLFGGSTWRLNSQSGTTAGSCDDVVEEKTASATNQNGAISKKRRPLSAVFAQSSSSSGGSKVNSGGTSAAERKRQSICLLKATSRGHVESCQSEFRFERINERRSKSFMNLHHNNSNHTAQMQQAAANRKRYDVITSNNNSNKAVVGGQHSRVTSSSCSSGGMISTAEKSASLMSLTPDEEQKLTNAHWFVDRLPKEVIQKVLTDECLGSFVVRRSTSQPQCLALTVRVPQQHNSTGVSHYLILRTSLGFRLKGFSKDFPSVHALVTHHSIMPEQLPCRLVFVHRDEQLFGAVAEQLALVKEEASLTENGPIGVGAASDSSVFIMTPTSTTTVTPATTDDADSSTYGAVVTSSTPTNQNQASPSSAQLRRLPSNVM